MLEKALLILRPGISFVIYANDYNTIQTDCDDLPTFEELQQKISELVQIESKLKLIEDIEKQLAFLDSKSIRAIREKDEYYISFYQEKIDSLVVDLKALK